MQISNMAVSQLTRSSPKMQEREEKKRITAFVVNQ